MEMRPTEQVFIVGMNGSGTTMLLDHLSSHPWLFGFPGETKVLPYFLTRESSYGDLAVDRNYEQLWQDMSRSIFGQARAQAQGTLSADVAANATRSVAFVFDRLMRSSPGMQGKRIWCEKSPMHVLHLRLIGNAFPDAKFIHVMRDGRDCAASFHRRWKFNPRRTIFRWKHAVRKGREQGAMLGSRYLEVRYEDMTKNPERSLRSICSFLRIPFHVSILDSGRSRQDVASAKSVKIIENKRAATQYFDKATLDDLERIAGKCLSELGYAANNTTGDREPSPVALRVWELADQARRLSVVLFRDGRVLKPGSWGFLARRIGSALKQKRATGGIQPLQTHRRGAEETSTASRNEGA